MRSKRRAVQAALFSLQNGTVREIASAAGCTRETARRHLADLFYEEMATFRNEKRILKRHYWVNSWYLTEKGREVLGALKILAEDVERLYLRDVPDPAGTCEDRFCDLRDYITMGAQDSSSLPV